MVDSGCSVIKNTLSSLNPWMLKWYPESPVVLMVSSVPAQSGQSASEVSRSRGTPGPTMTLVTVYRCTVILSRTGGSEYSDTSLEGSSSPGSSFSYK